MTVKELISLLQECDQEKKVISMVPHYDPLYVDSSDTEANMVYILVDGEDDCSVFGVVETNGDNTLIRNTLADE